MCVCVCGKKVRVEGVGGGGVLSCIESLGGPSHKGVCI